MAFTRRNFLRGTALSLGSLAGLSFDRLARALEVPLANRDGDAEMGPATHNGRALVVIQLAGGNDGLNTVVPFADPLYRALRPGIALDDGELLRLDDSVALHGAMTGLRGHFSKGQLAIVRGVGYPEANRSHFVSTAIWQTGRLEPHRDPEGWLGRALESEPFGGMRNFPGLGIGGGGLSPSLYAARAQVPSLASLDAFAMQPDKRYPNDAPALKAALTTVFSAGSDAAGARRVGATALGERVRQVGDSALRSSEVLRAAVTSYASTVTYPKGGFGDQLRLAAQLLAANLGIRVFHVTLGGFDTHANQKNQQRALLGQLSEGITALLDDARGHKLGDRVAVMTYSEFGRRCAENGSAGTDHGAASCLFVVGEKVAGGLHGPATDLAHLNGGDVVSKVDFRAVYRSVLRDWLSLDAESILGAAYPGLALFSA